MKPFQPNEKTLTFLAAYNLFKDDLIQQVQLQHRLSLVETFELPVGVRILEIGCGQGDTTVALAHAVGKNGEVVSIDKASRDYGAPLTLGQATDNILHSALGNRITFHFETDFEAFQETVPFDVAVLSHSSWYFKQPGELLIYFKKLRTLAKRICFAEWDLEFNKISQRAHFCAVSILALHSKFVENESNVQNLFDKQQIRQFLEQAGFQIENQITVDASYLPDVEWEKDYANSIRTEFIQEAPRMEPFLASYYHLMNQTSESEHSLNSFVILADSIS